MEKLTLIPFGDVVQKVSFSLFSELNQLLTILRPLTPELRTIRLYQFICEAKKKLYQLLILRRWLSSNNTISYFKSLYNFENDFTMLNNKLNEIQDGLYFIHRDLYFNRSHSLDIVTAKDILLTGTYNFLPIAIFSSSKLPIPENLLNTHLGKLKNDLNIFIRSKLYLNDSIPNNLNNVTIQDGILTITQPFLYELHLSLQTLTLESEWKILKLSLLCKNHEYEYSCYPEIEYDIKQYEKDVITVLQELSGESKCWKDMLDNSNRLISVTSSSSSSSSITDVPPTIIVSSSSSNNHNVTIDSSQSESKTSSQDHSNKKSENNLDNSKKFNLQLIDNICTHAASAVILRILYMQSIELKRTKLWMENIESDFQDFGELSYFSIRFWKNHTSREYRYELQILLPHKRIRQESINNSNKLTSFVVRLIIYGDLNDLNLPKQDRKEDSFKPIQSSSTNLEESNIKIINDEYDKLLSSLRGLNQSSTIHVDKSILLGINIDRHTVQHGVSVRQLLGNSIQVMTRIKIKVLFARIILSIALDSASCHPYEDFDFMITMSEDNCCLNIGFQSITLAIQVDVRSGKFLLSDNNSIETINGLKVVELFSNEVNNILSDQLVSAYSSSSIVQNEVNTILQSIESISCTNSRFITFIRNNYDKTLPIIYLKPIATFTCMLYCLSVAHVIQQYTFNNHDAIVLIPQPNQIYDELLLSINSYYIALESNSYLQSISTTSKSYSFSPLDSTLEVGVAYELSSWISSEKVVDQVYIKYRKKFPYSIISYISRRDKSINKLLHSSSSKRLLQSTITNGNEVQGNKKRKGPKKLFNESDAFKNTFQRKVQNKIHTTNINSSLSPLVGSNSSTNEIHIDKKLQSDNAGNIQDESIVDSLISHEEEEESSNISDLFLYLIVTQNTLSMMQRVSAVIVHKLYRSIDSKGSNVPRKMVILSENLLYASRNMNEIASTTDFTQFIQQAKDWKNKMCQEIRNDYSIDVCNFDSIGNGDTNKTKTKFFMFFINRSVIGRVVVADSYHVRLTIMFDTSKGLYKQFQTMKQDLNFYNSILIFATPQILSLLEKSCECSFSVDLQLVVNSSFGLDIKDRIGESGWVIICSAVSVPPSSSNGNMNANVDLQPKNYSIFTIIMSTLVQSFFTDQIFQNIDDLFSCFVDDSFIKICLQGCILMLSEKHNIQSKDLIKSAPNYLSDEKTLLRLKFHHIYYINGMMNPCVIYSLESYVYDNTNSFGIWVIDTFIKISLENSESQQFNVESGAITVTNMKFLFKEIADDGFEDRVDSAALKSLSNYESILARLKSIVDLNKG